LDSTATARAASDEKRDLAQATCAYLELSRDIATGRVGGRREIGTAVLALLKSRSSLAAMADARYATLVSFVRINILPRVEPYTTPTEHVTEDR